MLFYENSEKKAHSPSSVNSFRHAHFYAKFLQKQEDIRLEKNYLPSKNVLNVKIDVVCSDLAFIFGLKSGRYWGAFKFLSGISNWIHQGRKEHVFYYGINNKKYYFAVSPS